MVAPVITDEVLEMVARPSGMEAASLAAKGLHVTCMGVSLIRSGPRTSIHSSLQREAEAEHFILSRNSKNYSNPAMWSLDSFYYPF